jgi:hydrogenase maturation protein HypF
LAEPAVSRPHAELESVRITLAGHVQGVGFRPFVYRLASRHGIVGQVQNRLGEVDIVASGPAEVLQSFETDLVAKAPPLSRPVITGVEQLEARHDTGFHIAASSSDADARIFVPPDYFMCDDCRRELQDPDDRRYRYPFINCTQCGPRYTLIESLPYDRHNTSMASFPLCADCEREYLDPANRRFHAEPVACPACGPQVAYAVTGTEQALEADAALDAAIAALGDGRIVAVKGIGGYHLMCDASSVEAVAELRCRKQRPDKPLAVMFPIAGNDGLDVVRRHAILSDAELELLASPVRPIVLITRRPSSTLADNVAPALQEIGAFLPYSPLHQLLLEGFGGPLVATSGNISGEPVLSQNDEAAHRLDAVADAFLHHDRPIVRPADDPVYRRIAGKMRPLRLGRGCAPAELTLPWRQPAPLLAVGGHRISARWTAPAASPSSSRSPPTCRRSTASKQKGLSATRIPGTPLTSGRVDRRCPWRRSGTTRHMPVQWRPSSSVPGNGSCLPGTVSGSATTAASGAAKPCWALRAPGAAFAACVPSVFPVVNARDVSPGAAQQRCTGNAAGNGRTAPTSTASRSSPGGGN